ERSPRSPRRPTYLYQHRPPPSVTQDPVSAVTWWNPASRLRTDSQPRPPPTLACGPSRRSPTRVSHGQGRDRPPTCSRLPNVPAGELAFDLHVWVDVAGSNPRSPPMARADGAFLKVLVNASKR